MAVKFTSIDQTTRTATFDVDGVSVTRKIPKKLIGTIDEYLQALAKGLAVEALNSSEDVIGTPSFKKNEILVADDTSI